MAMKNVIKINNCYYGSIKENNKFILIVHLLNDLELFSLSDVELRSILGVTITCFYVRKSIEIDKSLIASASRKFE